MPELLFELKQDDGGWSTIGRLRPGDGVGSCTDIGPDSRDVVMFTCTGDSSLILRSRGGLDAEVGLIRVVASEGAEKLAELHSGEELTLLMRTERAGTRLVRWRHCA